MDVQYEDIESPGSTNSPASTSTLQPHAQDPAFYFPDGNLVLLVENTLFKVHASVLGQETMVFRNLVNPTEPISQDGGLIQVEGSGEMLFKVPNMKADHLRHFLFMFYSRPTNQGYRALMSNTTDFYQVENLNFLWYIYLDVAEVASRFMAPSLEAWALGQLRSIASSAYEELSRYSLRMEYRLRALLYAKRIHDDELLADIRNATQLHFSWVSKNSPLLTTLTTSALDSTRERLIWLFKYPGIQHIDPSLFGFVFCSLLGLGHEIWMNAASLSRDDRVMFLFGQVHLTPLPFPALGLGWLDTLTMQNQKGEGTPIECCSQCNFYVNWEAAFGGDYREQLRAIAPPLCGISHLTILPFKRLGFRGTLSEGESSSCENSCRTRVLARPLYVSAILRQSHPQEAPRGASPVFENSKGQDADHIVLGRSEPRLYKARKHLVDFFANYPSFKYDPSKPYMDEFWRLVTTMGFGRKGKRFKSAKKAARTAMILEFKDIYGTHDVDLDVWNRLFEVLGAETSKDLGNCHKAVKSIHVNICDLVDRPVTNTKIEVFETESELSIYTLDTQRIFPPVSKKEDQVIARLRRKITKPSKDTNKLAQTNEQSPLESTTPGSTSSDKGELAQMYTKY